MQFGSRRSILFLLSFLFLKAGICHGQNLLPKLSISKEKDGITILTDGDLFTRYLFQSGSRPTLWPIHGPTGKQMTRSYPVGKVRQGEETDHIHHRSMWIGYEGIGGYDYWHEKEKGVSRPFPSGEVKHRSIKEIKAKDNRVTLVAKNDWLSDQGDLVCTDTRTFQFGCDQEQRWIDCLLELKASSEPLKIGDSKEGFFALRVASSMRSDRRLGGKIVNNSGETDAQAWSQHASWVDYHGPIEGETLGIAILSHPENYHPEPRWHVRTYGLFAANPFGELAFTDPDTDVKRRAIRMILPAGDSLLLRYKVIFHQGDEKQAEIAEEFLHFSKLPIRDIWPENRQAPD